jgi:hypothetical protein
LDVFCFSERLQAPWFARGILIYKGWVAQLAEQWTENPRVGGSIPPPARFLIQIAMIGSVIEQADAI